MHKILFFLSIVVLLESCHTYRSGKAGSDLDRLQSYMTGSFHSGVQAARDSSYFDITLHMYPIWKERGHWMYVEQAVTARQKEPYRQRIYELVDKGAGVFESRVYMLPDPQSWVGAWKKKGAFDRLKPEDLELKAGCEVILKKKSDGAFSGSTGVQTCPSELRGASYATSMVTIDKHKIVSWDQGFNHEGIQVWGAAKGGYEFIKQKNKKKQTTK